MTASEEASALPVVPPADRPYKWASRILLALTILMVLLAGLIGATAYLFHNWDMPETAAQMSNDHLARLTSWLVVSLGLISVGVFVALRSFRYRVLVLAAVGLVQVWGIGYMLTVLSR